MTLILSTISGRLSSSEHECRLETCVGCVCFAGVWLRIASLHSLQDLFFLLLTQHHSRDNTTVITAIIISRAKIDVGTCFELTHSLTTTVEPVASRDTEVIAILLDDDSAGPDNEYLDSVEVDIVEPGRVEIACKELGGA
ncbi:hypothetical protein AJ78_02331 [Emergomyces pasteurianus Ep9510]|uniref:Uncharacterized protein n=1 Tax=Emergomyces pasteurianus Ep9510 TaxID=1447872 RepID=A0A1J9QNY4_9EURO|nr:hypothetical protein AJ78_02331 [Emergomyces pasteurianus Ep9510]